MKQRPVVTVYTCHLPAKAHTPSKASSLLRCPWLAPVPSTSQVAVHLPQASHSSDGLEPASTVWIAHVQRHHAWQVYLHHGDGQTLPISCPLLPPAPVIGNLVAHQHTYCSFYQEHPSLPFDTSDLSANGASSVRPSLLPWGLAIPVITGLFLLSLLRAEKSVGHLVGCL